MSSSLHQAVTRDQIENNVVLVVRIQYKTLGFRFRSELCLIGARPGHIGTNASNVSIQLWILKSMPVCLSSEPANCILPLSLNIYRFNFFISTLIIHFIKKYIL
jgi:hypothetical protein